MGSYPSGAVKMRYLFVGVFLCLGSAAYALPQVGKEPQPPVVSDVAVKEDDSSTGLTMSVGEVAVMEAADIVETGVKKVLKDKINKGKKKNADRTGNKQKKNKNNNKRKKNNKKNRNDKKQGRNAKGNNKDTKKNSKNKHKGSKKNTKKS